MALTLLLGGFFVGLPGLRVDQPAARGLTLTSSQHGSFFFLIVGTHACTCSAA
ncbi:MAG: hypothetical protein R3F59_00465 [Myxococcota bacterium]